MADSGSPLTLASKTIIPKELIQNLKPTTHNLEGATPGSKLTVLGTLETTMTLAESEFYCTVIVVENLSEKLIIGADFLSENKCIINYADLTFAAKDIKLPILSSDNGRKQGFCTIISKTMTIPPKSIADNVMCNLRTKQRSKTKVYVTQTGTFLPADNLLERKFNLKNTPGYITNFQRGRGYIQLTNTNEHPITFYKNQVVGTFEQIKQSSINTLNEIEDDHNVTQIPVEATKSDQERINKLYSDLKLDDLIDLSNEQMTALKDIISKYHHIFHLGDEDTLPEANLPPHKIILDTNKPIRTPYRQIPLALRPEAEKLVDDMVKKGIVERSNSPYHSPAFLIKKGNKQKLVIDYRQLNKHVIRNYQPLPRISDIISMWKDCQYWSTFDLTSAYHQIPLAKESVPITACSIPGVAFISFRRIPLGLSSAVGYFQSLMETTFLGLKNKVLVAYLDDLLSATTDIATMLVNIQLIFERLEKANLKLKPSKTRLFQKQVDFLGFKLSKQGQEITPQKISSITNLQPPINKKGVKSFMGFSSFFRKFIKGYATLMKPITELTKNGAPFV